MENPSKNSLNINTPLQNSNLRQIAVEYLGVYGAQVYFISHTKVIFRLIWKSQLSDNDQEICLTSLAKDHHKAGVRA